MIGRSSAGAASGLVVASMAVLLTVTVFVASVGGVLVAQRRAESAADLAALAGATAQASGASGCLAAERIAAQNRAHLVDCQVLGATVQAEVTQTARGLFATGVVVHATARAGPR